MTLVVNLFAGPGAGKSTTAARLFADLKMQGREVELALEFAKDLTWEGRHTAIRYQPYVAAKQMFRIHRLMDQVEIIITDSPILLSLIYKGDGYTPGFEQFIIETYKSWDTASVLIQRSQQKRYSEKGRSQTKEQALDLDQGIAKLLNDIEIAPFVTPGPPASHQPIMEYIDHCLIRPE